MQKILNRHEVEKQIQEMWDKVNGIPEEDNGRQDAGALEEW